MNRQWQIARWYEKYILMFYDRPGTLGERAWKIPAELIESALCALVFVIIDKIDPMSAIPHASLIYAVVIGGYMLYLFAKGVNKMLRQNGYSNLLRIAGKSTAISALPVLEYGVEYQNYRINIRLADGTNITVERRRIPKWLCEGAHLYVYTPADGTGYKIRPI